MGISKYGIRITVIFIVMILCIQMISCSDEPTTDRKGTVGTDAYVQTQSDTESEANDYEKILTEAFAAAEKTPAEMFGYEITDDGAVISEYKGNDKTVLIPVKIGDNKVVEIKKTTFTGNTKIYALYIPETVTKIEAGTLEGCTSLTTLKIPFLCDKNTPFGYLFGAEKYVNNQSKVPASLKTLILTGDNTEIGNFCFYGCNDIQALKIPENIKTIGKYAFYSCIALKCIMTGDNIKYIGEYAFAACTSMYWINLPETVDEIGLGVFEDCRNLTRMEVPFIGGGSSENNWFSYIFGAEKYSFGAGYIPATLKNVIITRGGVPDNSFFECNSIITIELPNDTETIGLRAFYGCLSLTEIKIPEKCVNIGDDAFYGCRSIVKIDFGENVGKIGLQAFSGCINLKEIEFPDNLNQIGNSAFYGCRTLTDVTFGKNTVNIGKNAFMNCDSISNVKNISSAVTEEGNECLNTARETQPD